MPNWVENTMYVFGNEDDVRTFMEEMATPVPSFVYPEGDYVHIDGKWKTVDKVFSFWNALAPTDLENYFTGGNWYTWNNANWGTKWDAKITEETLDELEFTRNKGDICPGTAQVTYRFDTAWGEPFGFYNAVVKKYPHLDFTIWYQEEQGWGGEFDGSNGKLTIIDQWDIPSSHEEYIERNMDSSCLCQYETAAQSMYEDCPARIAYEASQKA
jgi:hypothetical protein